MHRPRIPWLMLALCALASSLVSGAPGTPAGSLVTNTAISGSLPRPDTPGDELWISQFDGPASDQDGAQALAVSPDGSTVYATGGSVGSRGDEDYATVAYDAVTGAELWVQRYNGVGNGSDVAADLGVSPDGSTVFVTGTSDGSTTDSDYATVAYDAVTGAELWVQRHNGIGNGPDVAFALGVGPDGSHVYVTGSGERPATGLDFLTVAYDAADGTRVWVARGDGPAGGSDEAWALGVSPDGSQVFVTGYSSGDYATVAYRSATGVRMWARRYNGTGNGEDFSTALAVSTDGSTVFVTGQSRGTATFEDFATVAYDATTGARVWVKRFDGQSRLFGDRAEALGITPDGSRLLVTGRGGRTGNYVTLAYDTSSGEQLWVGSYNGPGNDSDFAVALAITPDGSTVFVTGHSTGDTTIYLDYATIAYDVVTGDQQWVQRHSSSGNGHDLATDLGVGSDGSKVFVTGMTSEPATATDYTTIAYSVP